VSDDSSSNSSYQNLIQDSGGQHSLAPVNPGIPGADTKPLRQLGANETLHVIVHGDGRGRVEGMNPSEFLGYLTVKGFNGRVHRGTIRLISCYSGTQTEEDTTFAESFAIALRDRGFTNAVIGFDGLVQAREGGAIRVVAPSNIKAFDMLSNVLITLTEHSLLVATHPPARLSSNGEEMKLWREYLQGINGVMKSRREEIEKLWEGQRIGKNIVHFESGTADLGRQRDARKFDSWHHRQLVAYNQIGPGEASRPSTDFSSSYIS
jgi:hypothetical protein